MLINGLGWLNFADVLDYCFGCESQYVGGAVWWRSLYERFSGHFISLFAQKLVIKVLICRSRCDPWPFPISAHLPSPLGCSPHFGISCYSVFWASEMNSDSKPQNPTVCRVFGPIWQQDRSIQMDHSKQPISPLDGKFDRQDETIDGREVVCALFPKHFKFQVPSYHQATLTEHRCCTALRPPAVKSTLLFFPIKSSIKCFLWYGDGASVC